MKKLLLIILCLFCYSMLFSESYKNVKLLIKTNHNETIELFKNDNFQYEDSNDNDSIDGQINSIIKKICKAKTISIDKCEKACIEEGEYTFECDNKKYEIQNNFLVFESTSEQFYRCNILDEIRNIRHHSKFFIHETGIDRISSLYNLKKRKFKSVNTKKLLMQYAGKYYNNNYELVKKYINEMVKACYFYDKKKIEDDCNVIFIKGNFSIHSKYLEEKGCYKSALSNPVDYIIKAYENETNVFNAYLIEQKDDENKIVFFVYNPNDENWYTYYLDKDSKEIKYILWD